MKKCTLSNGMVQIVNISFIITNVLYVEQYIYRMSMGVIKQQGEIVIYLFFVPNLCHIWQHLYDICISCYDDK